MQMFNLSSLRVMTMTHAVSSKLWQELPQSIKNYYSTNITFYIRKQAGKIDYEKTDGISYRQGFSTTKLLYANANCVNGEYCWVSRVSIKISLSVIREALHL